jgi:apolipoprotein N-acyltransferase
MWQCWRRGAAAAGGGLLVGASLPPVGLWPLAIFGLGAIDWSIRAAPVAARFRRGWLAGVSLLGPTTWWMRELTLPGWVLASLVLGALLGVALAAMPPGAGRWVALPGAWVLFEAVRGRWPFGGVPLSTLAVGQVAGPLASIARVGGSLLLAAVTVAAAVAVTAMVSRRPRAALVAAGAVAAASALAAAAPPGAGTGRWLMVDVVQGGGPQGTQAVDTDASDVVERHIAASRTVRVDADLVVWPEDVVDVDAPFEASDEGRQVADLSRRLDGVLVVGVIEETGDRFTNEAVALRGGQVVDRVGKKRRVPFGEFVPFRSLVEPFAPAMLPRRDAVVGRGPAVLDTPTGRFGVVVSWEVFFSDRARDAIGNGGQLLLNPTNGSSFTGTQVQSQQVASSRLRAIETGRWVLQAAPTGFSAVVDPEGRVLQRTGVSERAVLRADIELRRGRTWAITFGDWPALVLGAGLVAAGWVIARRRPFSPG